VPLEIHTPRAAVMTEMCVCSQTDPQAGCRLQCARLSGISSIDRIESRDLESLDRPVLQVPEI
jgi:hypothetical protein